MFNIVLVNPEIPQNTGNIVRTCSATGAVLHLIRPLGFSVEDKHLKRAGLDYWYGTEIHYYDSLEEFFEKYRGQPPRRSAAAASPPDGNPDSLNFYFCSTKAARNYAEAEYKAGDFLVFGCETKGLPEDLLAANYSDCIRIPMQPAARSLNLSNSVAIVLYEAYRQLGFGGLQTEGKLSSVRNP